MPYALELAMAVCDGSDSDRTMVEIARLMVRFYNIVSSQSQFLTQDAKEELPAIGQDLADYYSKLASEAFDAGKKLWKESPKLHLWEHLTEFQCLNFGNPRYYWCYADEDLVGAMIEIAETCHPNTLPVTVLFKWLHFFLLIGNENISLHVTAAGGGTPSTVPMRKEHGIPNSGIFHVTCARVRVMGIFSLTNCFSKGFTSLNLNNC